MPSTSWGSSELNPSDPKDQVRALVSLKTLEDLKDNHFPVFSVFGTVHGYYVCHVGGCELLKAIKDTMSSSIFVLQTES